jgi:glycerate dehydrogenase
MQSLQLRWQISSSTSPGIHLEHKTMNAAEIDRIVFLDRDTMPADISLRPFAFPHELIEFGATEPGQVAERIANADIVITNKAPVRRAELTSAPKLRL